MKKTFAILLSISLLLITFTGCGSSTASTSTETASDTQTAAASAEQTSWEKPGDFPFGDLPEGFDPENLPEGFSGAFQEGFDAENLPEGFDGTMPGGFTPGERPEGFDGEFPEDFDPENLPEGFTPGERPEGDPPSGGPGGTPPSGGRPGSSGGNGKPGGSTSASETSGAEVISSSAAQNGQTYASTSADESALLINTSGGVTINDPTVTKTGDSDGGDDCSFYGLNAAVLAKGGATVTITGGTVTSDANGANGVFCYGGNGGRNGASGDGTTLYIFDTAITTTGDGSGGIMTTGGGVTYATNLDISTSGRSSAAIRTDRGGGTVTVSGGTYTTSGLGSPAIYSTADIIVSDAELVSDLSEGVCIEGLNSITLTDCDLTANNTQCNGNATFCDTVMIYQSMSGDAASGTSSFTMTGGTLTSKNGHVFHVTNTAAVITLEKVTIVNEDEENILLSVCADGWSGGSNTASVKAISQKLEGTILVGSDSSLTLELTKNSSFKGSISGEITNAGGTKVSSEVGEVSVTLDSNSTWTLTGDTYITSFSGSAKNVITNGYTLYVNGTPLTGTK